MAAAAGDLGAQGLAVMMERLGLGPRQVAYEYLTNPRLFVAYIADTYLNIAPAQLVYERLEPSLLASQFSRTIGGAETVQSLQRIGGLLSEGRVLESVAEFSATTQSAFYSDLGHGVAGGITFVTKIAFGEEAAAGVASSITFASEKLGYVAIPLLGASIGLEIYDSVHNPMYQYVPNANISKWADIFAGLIPNPLWVSYFLRIFGVKKIGDVKFMTMSDILGEFSYYGVCICTSVV